MSKKMYQPERNYQFVAETTTARLKRAFEARETVTGLIRGSDIVNQCLFVKLNDTEEGILPFSECCLEPLKYCHNTIPGPIEQLLKKKVIRVKIEKWTDKRIVLSRRNNLLEVLERAENLVSKKVLATVENTTTSAAYCDIGDGLIAYCIEAEISKTRIKDVTNWFEKGETIKVIVSKVDLDNLKVSCSIKRADSFDYSKIRPKSNRMVKVGNPIYQQGKLTGYYVEVTPSIAGIADIREWNLKKYSNLQPGDKAQVYIRQVSPEERKVKMFFD